MNIKELQIEASIRRIDYERGLGRKLTPHECITNPIFADLIKEYLEVTKFYDKLIFEHIINYIAK